MTQATELRELASLIRVNNGNVGIGPLTADPPYTLSLGQTNVDGVEVSRSFSRHVIAPGDDITNESTEVQAICNAVHTQAVKDAYQAHLDSSENLE